MPEFLYRGDKPISVKLPWEQYSRSIYPSKNVQTSNDEKFVDYLLSFDNPHRQLFDKKPPTPKPIKKAKVVEQLKEAPTNG